MAHAVVMLLCSFLAVLSKGQTSEIQTQLTVLAAMGEEACLNCQLLQSKDVLQVTWQKILANGEKNLATNNKFFGQRVNPDFKDKVAFQNSAMQNCSIVIKKVANTDEGCYRCLFNTYPEGALTGRTCLQVFELHDPVLHVRESNSTEESLVSCSATGQPAPTITLSVSQQDLHLLHYNTVSVSNTNGTFTVTTTAVLSGLRKNSTQVGCAVRVLSAPQKEVFVILPEVKQMSDDIGFYERITSYNTESNFTWIIALAVVAVLAMLVVVMVVLLVNHGWVPAGIILRLKQQTKNGDPEEIKTPQRPNQDIRGINTPLMQQENEQVRQRTSTKKTPRSTHLKASPSLAKKLFDEDEMSQN